MKSKNTIAITVPCLFTTGSVFAKLPPPTDAQPVASEEAKAKAAEVAKKEAELLAKYQDLAVTRYLQEQKAKGVTVKPVSAAVAPPAPAAAQAKKK